MATIADACTHHFIIETPQPRMPKVKGTCARCGKESQFPAYQNPEDMSYAERHYLAMSGVRRRKNNTRSSIDLFGGMGADPR